MPFPIIGIGASAGGFEALSQFLEHLPVTSEVAIVIVQHLDPTRKGLMTELLQRSTQMKVVQVKDRTRIRPRYIYVIPPNRDMSVLHGVLHLFEPGAKRGQRLPIDFFLRSLAQDQQQRSIGVILSGMGSDGTLGLRDIKEKGGLVVVQEPTSAKFDSMPRSAIDAGLADIVAPVEELPERILAYLKSKPITTLPDDVIEEKMRSAMDKILILLRTRTGHDFTFYKRNTLYRRVERRMGIHQIEKIGNYVRFLQENPQELDLLFKEFLIGVTSFFRDPLVWKTLLEESLPDLLASRPEGPLRAWVAGCSTGEEAYSLAMVFKEVVDKLKPKKNFKLQIFATDLDRDAIDKARQGFFPDSIAADVSPERLHRFFSKEEGGYRVRTEIREMVIFSTHSLILDPPFTKLDLLSCRNLMIYLAPELQSKLLPLFHYSLTPGGILLLGNAETVGQFTDLFVTASVKARIFQATKSAVQADPIEFPSSFAPTLIGKQGTGPVQKPCLNLQTQAEHLVLRRYAPPTVLVNEQGNVLYISSPTGKYLEPAVGKANLNIFAMAREGLRYELGTAFQQALKQDGPVTLRSVKIGTNGGQHFANVTVERLEDAEPLAGLVTIVFREIPAPSEIEALPVKSKRPLANLRLVEYERELLKTRTELINTREEMQSSQEELKSANEEMQSTNEEMQSTNEELTTSKEEMQSLNEELQTVNAELQGKLDELSRSNNDMKNLLNSTDIATLFLDNDLKVRRFTTQATKIIKLIQGDVGRPITDLASDLLYPELTEDACDVLCKLDSAEKSVNTRDGRWFTVRISPYRTLDDRIDGVVITFWDISVAKTLEAKLQDMQITLKKRLAGQSTMLDKARVDLKKERKRTRISDTKPPRPTNT